MQETEDIARTASRAGVEAKFYLPEADAQLRAVVSDRGYEPVSYSFRFERRLDGAPGERGVAGGHERPTLPAEIRRDDRVRAPHGDVRRPGGDIQTRAIRSVVRAQHRRLPSTHHSGSSRRRTAIRPGFASASPSSARTRGLAWISVLGVRRPWRRKGVGLALLLHAFGDLYRRGFPAVGLSVHGENPTGAPRLYERAGMTVSRRYDHYARHLGPSAR